MTEKKLRGIYVIVNEDGRAVEIAQAVLSAGVRIVQYRAKRGIIPEHLRTLRRLTNDHEALLIVNDDWQAALEFDCDGVHLGPDDGAFSDVAFVREALGPERIIGLSCGTLEELALLGETKTVDYLGVGPVYVTASKSDAGDPIGIEGLQGVVAATSLPVCAIGGITAENVREIKNTAVPMAAVISAVSNAGDPERAARQLMQAWANG